MAIRIKGNPLPVMAVDLFSNGRQFVRVANEMLEKRQVLTAAFDSPAWDHYRRTVFKYRDLQDGEATPGAARSSPQGFGLAMPPKSSDMRR